MKPTKTSVAAPGRRQKEPDVWANAAHRSVGPEAQAGTHPRILLVDDDPGVRGSLGEVLMSEGFVVIPASDGQQAIELAASMEMDLVLLDLNMPRQNGWDTFERLSAGHPLLPILIVTARPNQLFTAVGAGVGALLEKPVEIPMLLRTIRRFLAEPTETRLARLAGRRTEFHYSAATT